MNLEREWQKGKEMFHVVKSNGRIPLNFLCIWLFYRNFKGSIPFVLKEYI